ncbi:hypothetical protein DFJ69_5353 [Thermomonospora umbrina]|uniref:Uncharacterized protein n=2 Tax=Thermomonospora umbrina TaxID=111806 RepID=A0A3D9SV80_9ACTN|nr:hypothetical protein DFJ69_5353 [Thermomonospora umbrina]
MLPEAGSSRVVFATAADELADRVLGVLRGAENAAFIARHVDAAPDAMAALAALRVVGADVFAPHLLTDTRLDPEDAAAVARSLTAFPTATVAPGAAEDPAAWAVAWRDWAVAELLARLDGGRHPVPPPGEEPPPDDWRSRSARMAQLAPLATPELDGPVHEAARRDTLALCRGVTRSMLRRDYLTAVRLIRWLARLHRDGVALPLDPRPALDHAAMLGGHGPRTALDIAVAERMLGPNGEEDR